MPSAVDSAFDVAFWFTDTSLNCHEYLQPQKLQRLLFMAQAYHLVAFKGKKLMPAVFVADDLGPIEPNVYAAFSKGRPDIDANLFIGPETEEFLDSIWRRFGHFSTEKLTRVLKESEAYKRARKRGRRAEISIDDMRLAFTRAKETPGVGQVLKPKMYRTQHGKAVTVKSWVPGAKA
jgi:uncharacterized phage-associated protein